MAGTQAGAAKLNPIESWTVLADAPLRGMALAREAVQLYAWDESDNLYCIDQLGRRLWASRAPGRVIAGAVSDDGSLLALLGESRRLWLYSHDLELRQDRDTPPDPLAVAVDPHGRFVVVSTRASQNQIYNAYGKPGGKFDTLQPLASMAFVPDRPLLVGAAGHGSLFGIDLFAAGSSLEAEVAWRQTVLSNVGRLAVTGDGGMILASCYSHGTQRFDESGRSEGAYHLGETVTHAVPDFLGRLIVAASQEGTLAILNRAGNIRWKTTLARPAVALELDALGRFLIHGDASGAITRRNLDGSPARSAETEPEARGARPGGAGRPPGIGSVREPAWSIPVVKSEDQAETAILAVLDQPERIALMTNSGRLRVFDTGGQEALESEPIAGVGRILRTAPGWVAAATDRQILLYNAVENRAEKVDLSLVQVTHLVLRPADFGLGIVQERDRIGRATMTGRWVWKKELDCPLEEVAVGPRGTMAVTTEDGRLRIYSASGEEQPARAAPAGEPLLLLGHPGRAEEGIAWFTLARHEQVVRGHRLDGSVGWELPVPWVSWQFLEVGPSLLVTAPDGRALAVDPNGRLLARRDEEAAPGVYGPGEDGLPALLSHLGPNLSCASISGRVNWRSLIEPGRRPMALGRAGAAVLVGKSLAWFPSGA